MMPKKLYNILGVGETADDAAIRKAYTMLVLRFHPDKNSDKSAAEIFIQIQSAYEILKDPATRLQYDRGKIDDEGKIITFSPQKQSASSADTYGMRSQQSKDPRSNPTRTSALSTDFNTKPKLIYWKNKWDTAQDPWRNGLYYSRVTARPFWARHSERSEEST